MTTRRSVNVATECLDKTRFWTRIQQLIQKGNGEDDNKDVLGLDIDGLSFCFGTGGVKLLRPSRLQRVEVFATFSVFGGIFDQPSKSSNNKDELTATKVVYRFTSRVKLEADTSTDIWSWLDVPENMIAVMKNIKKRFYASVKDVQRAVHTLGLKQSL